jgi:hypothetical protein
MSGGSGVGHAWGSLWALGGYTLLRWLAFHHPLAPSSRKGDLQRQRTGDTPVAPGRGVPLHSLVLGARIARLGFAVDFAGRRCRSVGWRFTIPCLFLKDGGIQRQGTGHTDDWCKRADSLGTRGLESDLPLVVKSTHQGWLGSLVTSRGRSGRPSFG